MTLHPRIARYGKSVRGPNGLRIEIREILRARDDTRVTKLHRISSLPSPTHSSSSGQLWVSKAISGGRKISKPRLQTPTLGKTPHLESLLFLDNPQKVTRNSSFERPKFRPDFKSKIEPVRAKIDRNPYTHQLEHEKYLRNHTLLD